MNNNIHPCLWFDGNAGEAANFYCSVFKNSKITVDTRLVVNFELCGKKFMGYPENPICCPEVLCRKKYPIKKTTKTNGVFLYLLFSENDLRTIIILILINKRKDINNKKPTTTACINKF